MGWVLHEGMVVLELFYLSNEFGSHSNEKCLLEVVRDFWMVRLSNFVLGELIWLSLIVIWEL